MCFIWCFYRFRLLHNLGILFEYTPFFSVLQILVLTRSPRSDQWVGCWWNRCLAAQPTIRSGASWTQPTRIPQVGGFAKHSCAWSAAYGPHLMVCTRSCNPRVCKSVHVPQYSWVAYCWSESNGESSKTEKHNSVSCMSHSDYMRTKSKDEIWKKNCYFSSLPIGFLFTLSYVFLYQF